jgi:protein phosphatase
MNIQSFGVSDIGRVRKENQDSSGYFPEAKLFVVADGMGGHRGGKQASEMAVASVAECVRTWNAQTTFEAALAALLEAVTRANQRIRERAACEPELTRMGTTFVALLFDGSDGGAVVHVGDSRAYRLRDGELELLTSDHTIVNDLLRNKDISEAEAKAHPYRHVLTRALGVERDVQPDVQKLDVRGGDVYVICSDGISGMLPAAEIRDTAIAHQNDPNALCQKLVEAANRAGGKDNATAIAIRCSPD